MNKFNKGDIVKRTDLTTNWLRASKGETIVKVIRKRSAGELIVVTLKGQHIGGFNFGWNPNYFELVEQLQVGDIVEVNKDVTIGQLAVNSWQGCQIYTLDFTKYANRNKQFKVLHVYKNTIILEDVDGNINPLAVKFVSRPVVIKEMTVAEISKLVGCDVKIVKEVK